MFSPATQLVEANNNMTASLPHVKRYWVCLSLLFIKKKKSGVYSPRVLHWLLVLALHMYCHATWRACVSYHVVTEDSHKAALWFPKHHASNLFSPKLQPEYQCLLLAPGKLTAYRD